MYPFIITLDDLFQKDIDALDKTRGIKEAMGMPYGSAMVKSQGKITYQYIIGEPTDNNDDYELFLEYVSSFEINKGRQIKRGDDMRVTLGYSYTVPNRIFEKPIKLGDKIEVNGYDLKVIGFYAEVGSAPD